MNPVIDIEAIGNGIFRSDVLIPADGAGTLPRFSLAIPNFRRAVYYAPFQKYAINPTLDLWPEGYNQCHALPVNRGELGSVKRGGMFALFELSWNRYAALLPLVTDELMAWLEGDGSGLSLAASHFGNVPLRTTQPLLAVGEGDSPYAAVDAVWKLARKTVDSFRLREEKKMPEFLNYLGWCTWEQYRDTINEPLLLKAIDVLDQSTVPVRWVLIDDGHLSQETPESLMVGGAGAEAPQDAARRKLNSLIPDRQKFPNGWQKIRERIRHSPKIQWSGVWLNFNGYWGGIAATNELGSLNQSLMEVSPNTLQPRDEAESSQRFYDAWVEAQARSGFDFIKVDNETQNIIFYRGRCANAVRAVHLNHQSMERAASERVQGLINCMAHNNLCAFNTRFSQITRCSEDYLFENVWRAKHHLHNSFSNMLWMSASVWGDHDMFHSSDRVAGEIMARSKAISGGPIYLSDAPDQFNESLISPLCLKSGRVLRPLAPAVPLPDSIFLDPYRAQEAYQVVAPLENRCAAWAAYNLTHPEQTVTARLDISDYGVAGKLLGERWAIPDEGLFCWNGKDRIGTRLDDQTIRSLEWKLPHFDDAFYLLVPIEQGWAVLGDPGKYLSPLCHRIASRTDQRIRLRVDGDEEIVFWKSANRLQSPHGVVSSIAPNVWKLQMSGDEGEIEIISE